MVVVVVEADSPEGQLCTRASPTLLLSAQASAAWQEAAGDPAAETLHALGRFCLQLLPGAR